MVRLAPPAAVIPRLIACLAVLLLLELPAVAGALAQDAPEETGERSPATGHAAVTAQGVVERPADEAVWVVSPRQAEPPAQSAAETHDGGFVLADEGVVALVDRRGALLAHLAPGEATWVAPRSPVAFVSLGNESVEFYDIVLAPANAATDPEGGIFGTPFAAPAGEAYDLVLVRDVVTRNEESDIPAGIARGILLVTGGTVRLETGDGAQVEVAAGETAEIDGDAIVSGVSRTPATFAVATVAAAVPARVALGGAAPTPAPTPTPTPQIEPRAMVTIVAFVCPPGYRDETPAVDCADDPAAGVEYTATANGEAVQAAAVDETGLLEFRGLPSGEYVFAAGVPGDFTSSWVRCLNQAAEDIARRHTTNQIALSLAAGDQITCSWFIIPVDARGDEPEPDPASLSVSAFICPVAYGGGDYAAACLEPAAGIEFGLSSGGVAVAATTAGPGGDLEFAPVAPGDYVLGAMVPGDFASSRVRCLNDAGEDIAQRAALNQIALALSAGATLACDWYIVPEDARGEEAEPRAVVRVAAFVCPAGFDGDYSAGCADPADGVEFSITTEADGALVDAGFAGPGGDVAFGGLPAGDYVLIAGIPGDFASSRVRCLNGVGEDITRRYATNQIAASVVPGDSVACNWYIVPVGEAG